jgi:GTPase SAR1 family protein
MSSPPPFTLDSTPFSSDPPQTIHSTVRFVFLGDSKIGKTSLVSSFFAEASNAGFDSSLSSSSPHPIIRRQYFNVQDQSIQLEYCDGPPEKLSAIQAYSSGDVYFLCFSISDRSSFDQAIQTHFNKIPIEMGKKGAKLVLIGLKKDLREKEKEREIAVDEQGKHEKTGEIKVSPISSSASSGSSKFVKIVEGKELAFKIGAVQYLEVSSKTGENVKAMMEVGLQWALKPKPNYKKTKENCSVQ